MTSLIRFIGQVVAESFRENPLFWLSFAMVSGFLSIIAGGRLVPIGWPVLGTLSIIGGLGLIGLGIVLYIKHRH